jgi:hypothetical protein
MRGIALLLLFANLCVGAYAYLDSLSYEPDPLHVPYRPERVKSLTSQQVAALGPGKVAQLNITCAEWGPLTDAERTTAMEILNPLQLGKTLALQRSEIANPVWVTVAAKPGKGGLDRTLKELQDLGVEGADKVKADEGNFVVAGAFRSEESARAQMNALASKGIKDVKLRPRDSALPATLIIIREPQQAAVAALEGAKVKLPDVPLAFASCRDRAPG